MRSRWLVAGAAALTAAGATAAAVAGSGSDGARAATVRLAAKAPVTAQVITTSRRNALRAGHMRVRLSAKGAVGVRLFATARRARGARRSYTITRPRLISLRRGRTRTVRLALNAAGRRILGGCRDLTLRAGGRSRRLRRGRRALAPASRLAAPARGLPRDLARCAGDPAGPGAGSGPGGGGPGDGTPPEDISAPPGGPPLGELDTANADRCDFLDPSLCLYPFPNDRFTVADSSTSTGRRLALDADSMPRNTEDQPIDPTDQNRADGFSPGNMIITRVPGLENQAAFDQTGAVPITDMERSFDSDQPVVVINASSKQRQLIWAELDANPEDPEDVTLIIRPGSNFDEGERYIVALRRMRGPTGEILAPQEEFRAYRDFASTDNPDIEAGRARYERMFKELGAAGVARRDLYLAWDFTVASERSLAGRALHIRDDAFEQLGDTDLANRQVEGATPVFAQNLDFDDNSPDPFDLVDTGPVPNPVDFEDLDGRRDFQPCSAGDPNQCEDGEHPNTARRITGNIAGIPCYLNQPDCAPGSGFQLDAEGNPQQLGVTTANVICTVPHSALEGGASSSRPSLYGHGLLGSAGEVGGGSAQPFGQAKNLTFCATDWIGMSTYDVPNVITLLQDLSRFNTLVDRTQQGYVNFMHLGRWMIHPDGASANAAFQDVSGNSLLDTERLFYDGNSQGGILSGGLTALAPDFDRAVHGVPGMNYSTLLRRSVDFDTYANGEIEGFTVPIGLYQSYPNELERPLILSAMQLLWDRGEANGYAHHMTDDPLPNSPPHQILLHPAFGDHQVANVAADTEARTIGASAYRPALDPGRSPDVEPLFGIPTAPLTGFTGSAIVYWDTGPPRPAGCDIEDPPDGCTGTPAPPIENVPPRVGKDPHSAPRADSKSWQQKSDFLSIGGTLTNPCGLGPCYAGGFGGP